VGAQPQPLIVYVPSAFARTSQKRQTPREGEQWSGQETANKKGGECVGVKGASLLFQAREWYREDLVGAALQESGVDRRSIFITSKLHPRHHGYETALAQFGQSLTDLKTDYLDLFLLHYPRCWTGLCNPPKGTWQDSWRALEALVDAGKIRAIGTSSVLPCGVGKTIFWTWQSLAKPITVYF
jgi:hypothetical protein